MLLFHGTQAPALDGILRHGLRPPNADADGHDWVRELSGRSQRNAVFLSTAPVAGKGGDPVSFAMGWPVKHKGHQPGYLIVVDLPAEAIALLHAVVPNIELETFVSVYRTRSWFRENVHLQASDAAGGDQSSLAKWTLSNWCLHYWLARWCSDHHVPLTPPALSEHFLLQAEGVDSALPPDLTPLRWQTFLDDYFRVVAFADWDIRSPAERERRRQTVLRRHGIVLPDHIEEDDHCRHCYLCIRGLASFVHRFEGFAEYQPLLAFLRTLPMKSSYQRLPGGARLGSYVMNAALPDDGLGAVESLAMRLRTVRAHTASFTDADVQIFFRTQELSGKWLREAPWTWEQWYSQFSAERCALPHNWLPGYCQHFIASDLQQPDRQVIAAAIPAQYIVGAIKISDGARLLPHLRPNRRKGETLPAKLWSLVHAMRAKYAGVPVLFD